MILMLTTAGEIIIDEENDGVSALREALLGSTQTSLISIQGHCAKLNSAAAESKGQDSVSSFVYCVSPTLFSADVNPQSISRDFIIEAHCKCRWTSSINGNTM